MEPGNHFQFGPFFLDGRERVLLRDGRLVPLAPKALSTLLVLVRNMGHVVEKDVLMAEVWPDGDVEEGNLAQHVFMLRKALGETNESRNYIETIPRRGYRFVAVEYPEAVSDSRRWDRDYNQRSTNVLEVQKGSSTQTSSAVTLNTEEKRLTEHDVENSVACQIYLKGDFYRSRFTCEGLEQAVYHFKQALELDPFYISAYAGIVDCYLRLTTNYFPPEDALPTTGTATGTPDETISKAETSIRIRQEWGRKIAERELDHAAELKVDYPTAQDWYAAYRFSLSLYNQTLTKTGLGFDAPIDKAQLLAPGPKLPGQAKSLSPTLAEGSHLFCMIAREQIAAGNYEAACAVLQPWWTMNEWPRLEGQDSHSFADLLVTAGSVAGYIASARQVPEGHKHAQALLNGAIGLFEQLRSKTRVAEARMELAWCYYREGMFDMARSTLLTALGTLSEHDDGELRCVALFRLSLVDLLAGRPHDALARLDECAGLVDLIGPLVSGRYNLQRGMTLRNLATAEKCEDYFELAIEHYQKALAVFEATGDHRHTATLEVNYGYLLLRLERLDEAEVYLLHARNLYDSLGDRVRGAQVDDALAQLHVALGKFELAEQHVVKAIEALERSGHETFLAEALTTRGLVLCKLGRHREAKRVLDRARQTAERCGDNEGAGHAVMTEIEEMCDRLDDDERSELASEMDLLLAHSQKTSTRDRLGKCHELIALAHARFEAQPEQPIHA